MFKPMAGSIAVLISVSVMIFTPTEAKQMKQSVDKRFTEQQQVIGSYTY